MKRVFSILVFVLLGVSLVSAGWFDFLIPTGKSDITGQVVRESINSSQMVYKGDFLRSNNRVHYWRDPFNLWKKCEGCLASGEAGLIDIINNETHTLAIQGYGYVYQDLTNSLKHYALYNVTFTAMATSDDGVTPGVTPLVYLKNRDSWDALPGAYYEVRSTVPTNHSFTFSLEEDDLNHYQLVLATLPSDAYKTHYAFFDNVRIEELSYEYSDIVCKDFDGKDLYKRSYAQENWTGQKTVYNDECKDEIYLKESACITGDDGYVRALANVLRCPQGSVCSEGACVTLKSNSVDSTLDEDTSESSLGPDTSGIEAEEEAPGLKKSSSGVVLEETLDNSCSAGECSIDGNCVSYGYRFTDDSGGSSYCDVGGIVATQKDEAASCQNDYECLSNSCSNGQCVEPATRRLLVRFFCSVTGVLGSGNSDLCLESSS